MSFGKIVKGFLILVGIMAILAWFGHTYELRDKNQPRLPIPTEISVPKVDVKR